MAGRFLHQPGEYISLLDLSGHCRFKTDSSISFSVGHRSDGLFDEVGWVDVHYPCEDEFCKFQIRAALPVEYESLEKMNALVQELFSAFAIPPDSAFELHLISGGRHCAVYNRPDVFICSLVESVDGSGHIEQLRQLEDATVAETGRAETKP